MPRHPSYIPDQNPFHLAGPPLHFLNKLRDFDDSLVVVPSRQGYYYRLAQRRHLQLAEKVVNDALFKESDTQMLASYNLVPVTTILSTANWSNPYLFEELRRRAPWRMGGAEAVNKMIAAQEREEMLSKVIKQDAMTTDLAKDAWKYYSMKTGRRTSMFSHNSKSEKSKISTIIQPNAPKPYVPLITTSWGNPNT